MKTLKGYQKIIIGLFVVLAIAAGGWLLFSNDKKPEAANPSSAVAPKTIIEYVAVEGQTALSQLEKEVEITTRQSDYGTLVESIGGLRNGTDGKYWIFYVNGTMADKGADAYITNEGDVLEWKFED
jgi:hypothetical protein